MGFEWLDNSVKGAVRKFWASRDGGNGVLGGKTLDSFVEIIERVVKESGLVNAKTYTGRNTSQLPGFFRPHKSWDVVVINEGELIVAVEFKSQVGSIGNNFNNRTEEVLGSSIDLKTAYEECAFGEDATIFTGYMILVEKSNNTLKTPRIEMKHFPVMEGFLLDESERGVTYKKLSDGSYPRTLGISYLDRYDVMCKRLMVKGLYTATAVIAAPNEDHHLGQYEHVSPQTSIETFIAKLASHCSVVANIQAQKTR